jgi:hypothetical protein
MRIARRELLERIPRDLLVRILEPFSAFFSAAEISLPALAATLQEDRTLVARIYGLLHADESAVPPELRERLLALDALATPAGQAALFEACPALAARRLGPEATAAAALLDDPDVFARTKRVSEAPLSLPMSEYNAVSHRAPHTISEAADALIAGFLPWLVDHGRTPKIVHHVTERGDEVHVEIQHGRLPATHDVVGVELDLKQVTAVHTERAHILLDRAKSLLAIHAAHPAIKDLLRRLVGEHFYGDAGHFRRSGVYTLDPLQRGLDAALSFADVPGIDGVALLSITVASADERVDRTALRVADLRTNGALELRAALAKGAIVEKCKLRVKLARGGRPLTLSLEPSKKKLPRVPADVALLIDEWLLARGYVATTERRIVIEPESLSSEDVGASSHA